VTQHDPERERFEQAFTSRNVPGTFEKLKQAKVGILGAGGLGSNVAAALVRAGVGHLIVADHDHVETSNLNRQLFFLDQVGRPKVEALAETLTRINPYVELILHRLRITPLNILTVFGEVDILVEALDQASEKASLIEAWLVQRPDGFIVAASGLAGFGDTERLEVKRVGRMILCGDGEKDAAMGLCASRVGAVAHMQANAVIEFLLK
jgi:sulfur carrier protein ThiS adenylyltransferase